MRGDEGEELRGWQDVGVGGIWDGEGEGRMERRRREVREGCIVRNGRIVWISSAEEKKRKARMVSVWVRLGTDVRCGDG